MELYGLTDIKLSKLSGVFYIYSDIEQVIIYGSRAMNTYAKFSDIDIVLVGSNITNQTLTKIIFDIEDLLLPYAFDISISHKINNPDVLDHIDRVGKVLYNRIEYSKLSGKQ